MGTLIITADDYGYSDRYDDGMIEAAGAGAVDSVSAFVTRSARGPEPLLATGVEVGLHLDLGFRGDAPRARPGDRLAAQRALEAQCSAFEETFGRRPTYLDGHHHCHRREGLGVVISDFAVSHALPVRSTDPRHRRLLRCRGVATPDLLVGRIAEGEPILPTELASAAPPVQGVVEWMVHPGRPDPDSGSSYDGGREDDLEFLLGWTPPEGVRRSTHAAAELRAPAC
jgi:predicted glycoside hydrolase/deacetylase ChbG (UPF0249 family)